ALNLFTKFNFARKPFAGFWGTKRGRLGKKRNLISLVGQISFAGMAMRAMWRSRHRRARVRGVRRLPRFAYDLSRKPIPLFGIMRPTQRCASVARPAGGAHARKTRPPDSPWRQHR